MSAEIGWIYAVVNGSMPGLVKIGASTNHPEERARQLSAPTSSPAPFVLAYSRMVHYPFQVEAAIHEALDAYRINDSREFFRLPVHVAIEAMDRYDEVRMMPPMEGLSYAELFATFPDDGSPRELTPDETAQVQELTRTLRGRA